MLPSLLLALREGVEAALMIGILFGVLRKMQRPDLSATIWWGVICAFLVSVLVAVGLTLAGASLKDPAEAIFEGITMLVAAGLLTWMIFWMHRHSRSLSGKIEQDMRRAFNRSGERALFGVAFLAVIREGIELALYLIAAGLVSKPGQEIVGALLGLTAAAILGWVMFASSRRLPLGGFFQVTNVLLILFAAGLISRSVHEFNELGWIPSVISHFYNIGSLLDGGSLAGQVLATLFGYNPNPSLTETLAYLVYFAVLAFCVFGLPRLTVARARAAQG